MNSGLQCIAATRELTTYFFQESPYYKSDLDFGRIWINSGPTNWSPKLPVGGKKMSGKSFDMGSQGFFNYLIPKSIYHRRNL